MHIDFTPIYTNHYICFCLYLNLKHVLLNLDVNLYIYLFDVSLYYEKVEIKINKQTMSKSTVSFKFCGDFMIFTFLETLKYTKPKKPCCHFFGSRLGCHIGISKWPPLSTILAYISISKPLSESLFGV